MSKRNIKSPPLDTTRKIVTEGGSVSGTDNDHPVFSFAHLVKGYTIKDCELRQKAAIAEKIETLSSLTWRQIMQSGRHELGCEKISRKAIRAGMPSIVSPDVDTFLAFRCSGKAPMVGLRQGAIFFVFWIDHDFTLYKH